MTVANSELDFKPINYAAKWVGLTLSRWYTWLL